MDKTNLKFKIDAYNQSGIQNGQPYRITYYYENDYNNHVVFKEVLIDIFSKFNINRYYNTEDALSLIYIFNPDILDIEYNFINLKPDISIYDCYDIKLGYLEQQFGLSKKRFELAIDPAIGGEVGRNRGVYFFFHMNEKDIHQIPHIHCRCSGEEFRVNLETLQPMDKTFKNKNRTSLTLDMIKLNKTELIRYWNKVVIKGESVKFKMHFPCK